MDKLNIETTHQLPSPLQKDASSVNKDTNERAQFRIDTSEIPCVSLENQAEELKDLCGVSVYDQTEFESGVIAQVDNAIKRETERNNALIRSNLKEVLNEISEVKKQLQEYDAVLQLQPTQLNKDLARRCAAVRHDKDLKLKQLKKLEARGKSLQHQLGDTLLLPGDEEATPAGCSQPQLENPTLASLKEVLSQRSEQERMIQYGQMTPFGTISTAGRKIKSAIQLSDSPTEFETFLLSQAKEKRLQHIKKKKKGQADGSKPSSKADAPKKLPINFNWKVKKVKKKIPLGSKHAVGTAWTSGSKNLLNRNFSSDPELSDYENGDYIDCDDDNMRTSGPNSDQEYLPGKDYGESEEEEFPTAGGAAKRKKRRVASSSSSPKKPRGKKTLDDGDKSYYAKRLSELRTQKLRERLERIHAGLEDQEEDNSCYEFEEGFQIPCSIWNKLFRYQKTCVRWLWELHRQNCGGIIGDEMGLGKTIQVIAFLVGLKASNQETLGDEFRGLGPVLLVCPATVMHQWVREFHTWWPQFRIAVLHDSGSFSGRKEDLVSEINRGAGILVTSYGSVARWQTTLLSHDWHYVILDEGHKIRNPNAQVTLACKQFGTCHRLILSGSPIQNNLRELWSLFDFVFPGKLGTLPTFLQMFSVPISQGGYANATEVQVQVAYKCAVVLRDTIKPYLLRRVKEDVKDSLQLPNKNEQVLFCRLTEEQKEVYKQYLDSPEVALMITEGREIFKGVINLRKICNHPDLITGGPAKVFADTDTSQLQEEDHFGYFRRSGKMIVVEALLKLWKKQGHRVLLFSQSSKMLKILERFVQERHYTYQFMDGATSVTSRQPLIIKFNQDPTIFLFLLTTRVGGLGVNLTGADRVVIYDPDWNPSTDAQAKERAWRIGQERQVTVYRLVTSGTIEEKIYHRQIYKQFLTNKVLKDPKQKRFFKTNNLFELFTLGDYKGKAQTETSDIFAGTGSEVKLKKLAKKVAQHQKDKKSREHPRFSKTKLEAMKLLAKKLSASLTNKTAPGIDASASSSSTIPDLGSQHQKKKKLKTAEFEGEQVDNLIRQEIFQPSIENEEDLQKNQDDYVLTKLFKKSGVHSALKHDHIINSTGPDYVLVEAEAERVAKEALAALKRSRRECPRPGSGIPTWTGSHGGNAKPRFGTKKRTLTFQPLLPDEEASTSSSTSNSAFSQFQSLSEKEPQNLSSKDLIARIRARNNLAPATTLGDAETSSQDSSMTEHDELLVEMRNFIAFQASTDGQAKTQEILDAFQHRLPPKDGPIFKCMLKKICEFFRDSSGNGVWRLKPEFR